MSKPKKLDCKHYDEDGFLARIPVDAWGNSFGYTSDGSDFEIRSLGADGRKGGMGAASDLVFRAGDPS